MLKINASREPIAERAPSGYRELMIAREGLVGPKRLADPGGTSLILFDEAADAPADATLEGTGFRYITMQVFKTDEEHAGVLARGGREGQKPQTLGKVARISFIRDPDGNWIGISRRASLTGSLD